CLIILTKILDRAAQLANPAAELAPCQQVVRRRGPVVLEVNGSERNATMGEGNESLDRQRLAAWT
ncbi:MAG TPA: hypothetical protein VLK82_16710, partial [Candidatus Tectomicrobia bacterium]|nr:hypothetical protein [Candidatus Tectomicrobia bacterium]